MDEPEGDEIVAVYTRSVISEKTGIGFDAIRYYERFGLLPEPPRSSNGYRQYDEEAVERLMFIQQAKKCGFALREIKKMFDMLDHPENCNMDTDEMINLKIHEIDDKIQELYRMKEMLQAVREPLRLKCCNQIKSYFSEKHLASHTSE